MIFDFGMRLRELRKNKHWSQQQLANKIAVSKASISAYERNLKTPSAEIIKALAVTFYVSADDLLGIKRPSNVYTDNLSAAQKQMLELIFNIAKGLAGPLPEPSPKRPCRGLL